MKLKLAQRVSSTPGGTMFEPTLPRRLNLVKKALETSQKHVEGTLDKGMRRPC